jgi:hypothetical protein
VLLAVASGVDAQVAIRDAAATAPPNISVGGQVREQYERFQHEEWGGETPDDNGYWLQRYMFHVDAQVWRGLRAYVELKSGIEVGRAGGPRPPDEDQLDLHQAFRTFRSDLRRSDSADKSSPSERSASSRCAKVPT